MDFKSSALLKEELLANGFTIKSGVAEIPTAFIAEYSNGGPVIGILGEYDALPGLMQTASPFKEERDDAPHWMTDREIEDLGFDKLD